MKNALLSFSLIFVFLYSFVLPLGNGSAKNFILKSNFSGFEEEWSEGAGLNTRDYEYGLLQTSQWIKMMVNLHSGNQIMQADLFHLPAASISLYFTLTYNSLNSLTDLGIGKGWTSNLHARILENPESKNLTYIDGTGFIRKFIWDTENQKYLNPFGFSGIAQKLQTGFYQIAPLGSSTILFDSNGRLIEIQDRYSAGKLVISYTDAGQPQSLTDLLTGKSLNFTWDQSGYLTAVKDMMNHEWYFIRDENHFLTELIKPGETSVKTLFGYDNTTGLMLSHTDFENQTYMMEYYTAGEGVGLLKTLIQPASEEVKTSFAYELISGYERKTTVTDGNDHVLYYFFGSNTHALEKIISGNNGPVQLIHYNSAGFVDSYTDALGLITNFVFDTVGHLVSVVFPPPVENGISPIHEFVYDSADLQGNLINYREKVANTEPPTWSTTQYFYTDANAPHQPTMVINPMNQMITFMYDTNGMLLSVTEPTVERGNPPVSTKFTYFTYDSVNKNLLRKTDTEGNDTSYQYNLNGLPIAETQYEGSYLEGKVLHHREFAYNPLCQVTSRTNTLTNQSASMTWNHNGVLVEQVTEKGCQESIVPNYQNLVILPGDPKLCNILEKKADNISDLLLPKTRIIYQPNYSSSIDMFGHTSTFEYRNNGTLFKETDYLNKTVEFSQDNLGRISGITESNGHSISYSYNMNSQIISIISNRDGTTILNYDGAGRILQKVSPVKGTIDYTYNIRGDKLSDEKGEYYYDMLGRLTGISYINGDSDFWTYDADGKVASHNGTIFEYDKIGNIMKWQNENADVGLFEFNESASSRVLGLPSSLTGSGNLSSYTYLWNTEGWLTSLIPVEKVGSYQYGWSSTKELSTLFFPNTVSMSQTWTNKVLDSVSVQCNQINCLLTDIEFDTNDRLSEYTQSVLTDEQNYLHETNNIAYDLQSRISELRYQSLNRTIQYHYRDDSLPDSISFSDLGQYSISYNFLTGNINSVTYPQQSGTESYLYDGGLERLSRINYPENKSLNMIWNDKNQITRITYNDQGIVTNYIFTYAVSGHLAGYTKIQGGIQTANWVFTYGPFGLEKAVRTTNPSITEDFTTDPSGRILAMTYTQEGGEANGEYYFHYDNYGNTILLTDSLGKPQYAALYDIWTGKPQSEWNPNNLEVINQGAGMNGTITLDLPDMIEVAISETIHIRNYYASLVISSTTVRIESELSPLRTKQECRELCYKDCTIDPLLLRRCLRACEEGTFCSE